ncbi:hypothetical protein GGI25_001742 [Coemansia spiralis]|uniref:Cation-transporting P-type ATPase N-terminal domain-containing protein n=2 Tax=Coemansia TaxID=4863 RepID=A0A9W8KZ72_9FUNG|nr:hypothetical protein EDC05_006423 [Coemansia umbellata]KAJ2624918.1 hypothetical protein GGI26_001030 [Coemansia sp. RSA 1358]KAJ2679174.1 hypothetical protein GGI25_001742 [Coemansia spiralis]
MVNTEQHGRAYTEQDLNYNFSGSSPLASFVSEPNVEPLSQANSAAIVPYAADECTSAIIATPTTGNSDYVDHDVACGAAALSSNDMVLGEKLAANIDFGGPEISPGAAPPVIDGKESVEFQIGIHVVDLFDILASRGSDSGSGPSRRYQLVHNNPLLRHMRDATNNILRSSPSSTTIASSVTQHSVQDSGAQEQQLDAAPDGSAHANSGAGVDLSLAEILDSLQYVVDYRLKGRQQPHLNADLMRRLCDALLLTMATVQGSFLNKRLTEDARSAYFLFGQFIEEVNEFQQCVGEKPTADLRRALKLHKRITDGGPEEEKLALVTIIRLVLACLAPGHDWRDLVDEHEQRSIAPVVERYSQIIEDDTTSYHMPVTGGVVYPPPSLYFDRTVEKLSAMFKTDVTKGLTTEQVQERREFYGVNELPRPVRRSWWRIIWAQLTDLMILMLCAAIIATAVDGEWKSSIVLGVVVVLNTFVGSWQEIKAGKALSALENLGTTTAQVIRNGVLESIDAADLVPGDLVEIGEGESIPADLRLIFCAQLEIVESVLTGESVGVTKDPKAIKVRTRQLPLGDCKGNAFMSTLVSHGRGRGIVIRTGSKTEIGKISVAINRSASTVRPTPIQKKLTRLGIWLVVLALLLCAIIVICGVSWGRKFVPIFITGISLAVSVIPEGLVAVTTVTMALGVRRMARRNALVRTLPAVETLGGVTVICSDKTGTLTEGKMGVSELVDANGMLFEFSKSTSRNPNEGEITYTEEAGNVGNRFNSGAPILHSIEKHSTAAADISFVTAAMCNNAEVFFDESTGQWSSLGDATEVAMTIAVQKAGLRKTDITIAAEKEVSTSTAAGAFTAISNSEDGYPSIDAPFKLLAENAFDSDRKRMSVVYEVKCTKTVEINSSNSDNVSVMAHKRCLLTFVKGAPEEILSVCTHQLSNAAGFLRQGHHSDGKPAILPPNEIASGLISCLDNDNALLLTNELTCTAGETCEKMAARGLRVLGLAAKVTYIDADVPTTEEALGLAWAESDLVFAGLMGLIDPPRSGIVEAVQRCHNAGIKVIMITGDHIGTATAIAKSIGIINEDRPDTQRAISGAELDLLSDEATMLLDPFPSVFARVSPENKIKIVRALQQCGHVVAMTGDGVNDAAAVKGADVGVAMGLGGTDITKQAADIVLVDDNFTTIVAAVEEGRRIFDNILKFILYLLSCNSAEIILFLYASVLNLDLPFTTIMILWANIIADIPPALSLGLDPPERNIMNRPPRNPKSGVLTKSTTLVLVLQALFMATTTFAVFIAAALTPFGNIVLLNKDNTSPDTYVPSIFHRGNPDMNADKNSSPHIAGARSIAFGVLTVLQLNQAFLSRSVDVSLFKTGLRSNKWMVGCVLLSFVLYVMGTYVPGLNNWLELVPLDWQAWLVILGAVLLQIVFSEAMKMVLRKLARKNNPDYSTPNV